MFTNYCLSLFVFILINKNRCTVNIDLDDNFLRGITILEWNADILSDDRLRSIIMEVKDIGTNWISLSILLSQTSENSSDPQFWNNNATEIVRDFEYISDFIDYVHSKHFKVMLKPMVYPENIPLSIHINPIDIDEWFNNYNYIILQYADLAQTLDVELISIGYELFDITSDSNNTKYWISMIHKIREIYDGELTYCSFFMDEYKNIEFWNELDYIGIDAYFPLTDESNKFPSINELEIAWETHLKSLQEWQQDTNLTDINILFTEIGYPSINMAPIKPYYNPTKCSNNPDDVGGDEYITNKTMQSMCYKGLFGGLSSEIGKQIIYGMFLFWIDTPDTVDSYNNGQLYDCFFTPRGKPSWNVLKTGYATIENGTDQAVKIWKIIIVVTCFVIGFILIAIILCLICKRKKRAASGYSIMMQNV